MACRAAFWRSFAIALGLLATGCSDDFRGTVLAPLMFTDAATDSTGLYREPNDTPEQAIPLKTDGARIRQTLHLPSDVDFFRFLAASGAEYLVNSEMETGGAIQAEVTDARGIVQPTVVLSPGNGSTVTRSWTPTESGYFFVRVSAPGGASAAVGTYSLWISVGDDGFEPDNTISGAKGIAVNGSWQQRTISGADDSDYIGFSAWGGFRYEFTFDGSSAGNLSFSVVDGSGSRVSSPMNQSTVRFDAFADGTYYVEMMPNGAGALGTYRLSGVSRDPWEPDSTLGLAAPISTGGEFQRHSFSWASDHDLVKFDASAGVRYVIRTDSLGEGVDTQIEVISASGTALLSDDNGGGGKASRLEWTAPASATYFVRIRSTGAGLPGKYVISVERT